MSGPGVSFRIDAITEGFTRGMAKVNNAINDTKKSVRAFDVGNGLKQVLGVGGIIQGFRSIISHAQETRDNLEKWGKPVDDATRSVAAYGDALDKLKVGIGGVAVKTFSFFTKAGEGWGMLINRMRGISRAQEKVAEEAAKGADEQEAAAKAAREAEFGKDAVRGARKAADKAADDAAFKGAQGQEEQLTMLLKKRAALEEKLAGSPKDAKGNYGKSYYETQSEISNLDADIKGRSQGILKDAMAQDADYKEKKRNEIRDKFAPSVEQLAEMSVGMGVGGDDPRLRARKIMELEGRAASLTGAGRFKEGIALAGQAQTMREGLSDITGKGSALTQGNAEAAFKAALETTNGKLDTLTDAVSGVIRATP